MAGRAGDPLTDARQVWRELVSAVGQLGREFGLEAMGRAKGRAFAVDFPVEGESARLTASALLRLADAYRAAAIEARRYHIGRALEATALAVDGLLDEHLQTAADLARLRIGERD
jgi:hypothetical protein